MSDHPSSRGNPHDTIEFCVLFEAGKKETNSNFRPALVRRALTTMLTMFALRNLSYSERIGVLAASIDVIGIPKRVLTSPDLAAYVMKEGDDGEEGGRAEASEY